MVSFTSIITALAFAASAVNAIALPNPNEYYTDAKEVTRREFKDIEPVAILMKCTLSKDGQITSKFLEVGLFTTVESSQDGSIPSDYLGPRRLPSWESFGDPKSQKLIDGRHFIPALDAGNLDAQCNAPVGTMRISKQESADTTIQYIFDCARDNEREVFHAKYQGQKVHCYAVHTCKFGNRAVA
ncbi:hypothetical protein HDU97_009870 [Phlyctochytrium planicorne]|nr:hypothetical protein HDU97_009870 [Phlyctochytrium planicorne]